ncbi:ESPR-type extended signal peptide-containing protein [Luteimonas sp. A478]
MNKIYSKVWNKELGQLVVASEFARSDSTGVVQGAGAATLLRRSLLAAVIAPMLALAGLAGSTAFAQDASWTVTDGGNNGAVIGDGGTVAFQGGSNISVAQTGDDDAGTVVISLDDEVDLGADGRLTIGNTLVNNSGVRVGGTVLNNAGLTVGGVNVTTDGINAGGTVITGVAAGGNATDAVNYGQHQAVVAAANTAQSTAEAARTAAEAAANTAGAGWNISAEDGAAANVGPGDSVDFSGDGNIEVVRTDTNLAFSLADEIEVGSIVVGAVDGVGGMTLDADGIDVDGKVITGLAHGDIALDSTDAVTGHQLHNALFEGGTAFGVRYFRVNSEGNDSLASGAESVAIGPDSVSAGESSFAAGDGATTTATGEGAIAMGQGATAGGAQTGGEAAIAIGRESAASGNSAVALGDGASAAAGNATAVGANATASGGGSIAIGNAEAVAANSFAAGSGAIAATRDSIALGAGAGQGTGSEINDPGQRHSFIAIGRDAGQNVDGNQAISIGVAAGSNSAGSNQVAIGAEAGASLSGERNVSLGYQANRATGDVDHAVAVGGLTRAMSDAVALGYGANADYSSIALGAGARAEDASVALGHNSHALQVSGTSFQTGVAYTGPSVSVGNAATKLTRRITNVEDGADGYDAVNVRQLESLKETLGSFDPESGGNVNYNADGTITVEAATAADRAVNLAQMNAAIAEERPRFFSINPNGDSANENGEGALGPDSANSMAIGHAAAIDSAQRATAVGYNVRVKGEDGTALGSGSIVDDAAGVAVGSGAYSRGTNSLAIGTDAQTEEKGVGQLADNAIAIGTSARASDDSASALGHHATASGARSSAVGYRAHAEGINSLSFGTTSHASNLNSQASGTNAMASGESSQASGTNASAHRENAIATGTGAAGWAFDGIALGSEAVAGFEDPANIDPDGNTGAIAIGASASAIYRHAIALGVDAHSDAESSTAIGDSSQATAEDALAIGSKAGASAQNALAIGSEAGASAQNASALGRSAAATAVDAMAMGTNAQATGIRASAIGQGADADSQDALAVGTGARAAALNAVAFGQGARATHANAVALGAGSETAEVVRTPNAEIDGITYNYAGATDGVTSTVSVGRVGAERTITNVAAGRVDEESTDAINGSQLYGTNMALESLADDLDTAGQSIADVLGGNAAYDPDTHQVTMTNVGGTGEDTVHEAIEYAAQGWDVGVNSEAGANVAPGGSVDFSNTDENIVIARDGTNLTFDLADDLTIGNRITTTNLTVGGETRLGDNFFVNNDGEVYYNDAEIATQNDGLNFAGNTGDMISRTLGDPTPLTIWGGLADGKASTGANLRVDSDGERLNLVMARDLTDLDSVIINGGLEISGDGIDMAGQQISNLADGDEDHHAVNLGQLNAVRDAVSAGWTVTDAENNAAGIGPGGEVAFVGDDNITVVQTGADDAGVVEIALNDSITLGDGDEAVTIDGDRGLVSVGDTAIDGEGVAVTDGTGSSTEVDAGTISVSDADGETLISGNQVSIGNQIMINGGSGTIEGLTNVDLDGADFAQAGRAATEEQLSLVNETANMGWNVSANGDGATANVAPGSTVDFSNDDGNIVVSRDDTDLNFNLAGDIAVDSLALNGTAGADGLTIRGARGTPGVGGTGGITRIVYTDDEGNDREVATMDDGLVFAGNTGDDIARTLGETLTVSGELEEGKDATGDNLRVDSADGQLNLVMAQDLTDLNSITINNGGPVISSGGIDMNDNRITNLADGTEDDHAVNLGQLEGVEAIANRGWDISTNDGDLANVAPGDSVNFADDGNVLVSNVVGDDGEHTVALALNPDLTDLDSIGLNGIDGQAGLTIRGGDGSPGLDGADGITRIIYEDADGTPHEVATLNDGLTFVGNTGDDIAKTLGETLTISGELEEGKDATDANLRVDSADGQLNLVMAQDLTDLNSITINNGGPVISSGGIDMSANRITNLARGVDGADAVNVDQLNEVSDAANAGWNISVDGEGATADNNVGPGGTVDFANTDDNIVVARDGTDLVFDLSDELEIGTSITVDDNVFIDTTGVAIGTDVHLGNTGLVINGGPSVTLTGIDAGNMVITNVAPGEISATSTDAINGSQLHGMGDSIVNVIGGNAELNPDGTIVTSDIGGTGHDNIDDAIRSANDAANAGWTATDAGGNDANIGPNGSVAFTGDGNISVAQTGDDNSGEIEITLNRDLDVDSITAGDTVIDTDGVRVGDDVHLGDTGLVIEGGPSVTTDGIDAGGSVITNVAAGVNDTDAANVGQLNQVAGDVNDLGDRMDVVEGDVSDLQAGATGPFQVSQEAPIVAPTPTGANSAAGGSGADASGDNSTALGNQAVASGANSTAVGQGAQAAHDNSVALGQGSATTVGAQSGYDAAYVGSSSSSGEVNVGNRTISGVAPGVAGNDAVNVNQLNAGVNHAVVTANDYTDQRINQVQGDVWHLHGRVDDLEKSINSGVATAMAMRQAPYVAGATTYFAGFGAYKDQGALGVSLRRTADNGRWSLEGGFSANRDGAGGYVGVSGVLGSK